MLILLQISEEYPADLRGEISAHLHREVNTVPQYHTVKEVIPQYRAVREVIPQYHTVKEVIPHS